MAEQPIRRKKPSSNESDIVSVYVRNYAKKAITLKVPSKVKISALKSSITKKMKISKNDQVLFLNGNQIPDDLDEIEVENRFIFHLANLKRIGYDNMTIFIKRVPKDSPVHEFQVSSQMKISEFIKQKVSQKYPEYENYFLVYTGRQMMPQNTFEQQYIEDQSELLCVHKVQDRKSQYIQIRRIPAKQASQRHLSMLKKKQKQSQQTNSQKIKQKFIKIHQDGNQQDQFKNKKASQKSNGGQTTTCSETGFIKKEQDQMIPQQTNKKRQVYEQIKQRFDQLKSDQKKQVLDQQNYSAFKKNSKTKSSSYTNQKQQEPQQKIMKTERSSDYCKIMQQRTLQNQKPQHQQSINKKATSKAKSESQFTVNTPFKFSWNKFDDSKNLIQMSSKMCINQLNLGQILSENTANYIEGHYECKEQKPHKRFQPTDLILLGSAYSLGLESIRDSIYEDFQNKIKQRQLLGV